MPNHVAFTDRFTGQFVSFQTLDDRMREAFGYPPSQDDWLMGWHDSIGLYCSLGMSMDKIRQTMRTGAVDQLKPCRDSNPFETYRLFVEYITVIARICDYLQSNVTCQNWVRIGK